jgi:dTDP-4-dehydrorhamnose reductase
MKIGVIGANGQLGTDITNAFRAADHEVVELNHDRISVDDQDSVNSVLGEERPDMVVNTAAYHHVEKCETETELAFGVNAIGSRNLALAAKELDHYLLHISTDYVFDGLKGAPYVEEDEVMPLNVYANSKLAGEYFVRTIAPKSLVMRVSGIYGKAPCRVKGYNFVELMLKLAVERDELKVVDDETLTPTSTLSIAKQIVHLADKEAYGLCHATAEGSCTWYAFAKKIFELRNMDVNLNIAAPGDFPVTVNRPSYSVLENKFLKDNGWNVMESWEDQLAEYLAL